MLPPQFWIPKWNYLRLKCWWVQIFFFFSQEGNMDFWLWNTALVPCFCLPPLCQSTKSHARSREKGSDIFGVCWLNFTNTRFICFSFLKQRRRKLEHNAAPRLLWITRLWMFCFSRKKIWMNEKQETKGWQKKKSLFWLKVHPDTVSRGEMGFWLRSLPEVAHRDIASGGVIPLAPREAGFARPWKWAELGRRCLNSLLISLLVTSSRVLYFGWLFYITSFPQYLVGVSIEKSQNAEENDLLSIPFVTRGTKRWTPLRRPCCHEVSSLYLREGFNFARGTTGQWSTPQLAFWRMHFGLAMMTTVLWTAVPIQFMHNQTQLYLINEFTPVWSRAPIWPAFSFLYCNKLFLLTEQSLPKFLMLWFMWNN